VVATRIFADIGIPLDWRACEPADESSQTPIVVQLVSGKNEGLMSGVLGYAAPYRRHIIIFFDRVERMQDAWTVLGHVMAHEITHVIQGVARHSDTGLMKPRWSSRDLRQMRYKPLPFTREDLMLIYSALGMRRESTDTGLFPPSTAMVRAESAETRALAGVQLADIKEPPVE
jgi:hypothetical protein